MSTIEKLTTHLQDHWKQYLLPETTRRDAMMLHRYDSLWVAYELSAYFLYHACQASILMVTQVEDNPFPVLVCFVPVDQCDLDAAQVSLLQSDDYSCTYKSQLPTADYADWRACKIKARQQYAPKASYFDIRLTAHGSIHALGIGLH